MEKKSDEMLKAAGQSHVHTAHLLCLWPFMKSPKSAILKDKSNNKPYSLGMVHVMVKCLGIPREMLKLQNDLFCVHYWWVYNVQ